MTTQKSNQQLKDEQNYQGKIKTVDDFLDEALKETFPASDPIAIRKPEKTFTLKKQADKKD